MVAPGAAFHTKVIEVPYTVAPLLGENKVGATSAEGGLGVGVGSVPPPKSEQANPEASNIHKSNTMVTFDGFTFCLQLVQEISR